MEKKRKHAASYLGEERCPPRILWVLCLRVSNFEKHDLPRAFFISPITGLDLGKNHLDKSYKYPISTPNAQPVGSMGLVYTPIGKHLYLVDLNGLQPVKLKLSTCMTSFHMHAIVPPLGFGLRPYGQDNPRGIEAIVHPIELS